MRRYILSFWAFLFFVALAPQVFALSLSISAQIKNLTTDEGFLPNVTITPGQDVMILFTVTNSSGENATGLTFSPSDLLFGEINGYFGDTSMTLFGNDWVGPAQFQIHTNTQVKQNYAYGAFPNTTSLDIYVPFHIPTNYNKASQTFTLAPSCDQGCTVAGSTTQTFSVGVAPSLSGAAFSNAILNNASNSATLTVTASDPSGISDIASVKVDLASIGGANNISLYDDGAHGDTAAGDGIWGATGITTSTASAGSYTITLTVTDSGGNTGTTTANLNVQSSGSPIVSLDSQSKTVVSDVSGYTSSDITWRSTQACGAGASQGYRIVLGGTAGDANTGTVLTDWQASGCSANTPQTNTINALSLALGANNIYMYVKTSDNYLGYLTVSLSKDTTAPTLSINGTTTTILGTANGNISWYTGEAGTYTVRTGGSSGNASSGTQVTGTNASGSYSAGQASSSTIISSQYLASDLTEGANTMFLHFTDLGGNVTSHQFSVTKDSTPPVSGPSSIALTDNDLSNAGVDGRDFTFTWTEPTDTSHITSYSVYIYKSIDSYTGGDTVKASIPVATTSYTWDASTTTDSKGNPLVPGSYRVAVISVGSGSYENSATVYGGTATISAEDTNPPVFSSAKFVSGNRIQITFDKLLSTNLSDHDATKISSSYFIVNTALGTNGVQSINSSSIFVHIQPLNDTGANTNTLNFSATYSQDSVTPTTCNKPVIVGFVRSSTGVIGPVANRGTFDVNTPIVNAVQNIDGSISGQSVSDGQAPNPLVITAPAASTKTNSGTLSFQYSLPESMDSSTLKVRFTRTGGATDAASPHTIVLTNAGAGSQSQSITLTSFTSIEHGAGDTLANGGVYTLDLMGYDLAGNQATTVSATGFMYDTVAPSIPVVQRFPSGAPSNNYWTTSNAPLLQWSASSDTNGIDHYLVQIASDSGFSLVQAYTTTSATSWQVPSALGDGAYYWRVLAYDPALNASAGQSTVEGFIVDTTGPSITVNSSPSSRALSALTIALNAPNDGVTGVGNNVSGYLYSLFKADANCSSNATTSTFTTSTSYPFSSLTANTNYCFKTQAKDGLGNLGAFSATVLVGTLANQVTGFSGVPSYSGNHAIALSWTNQSQSGVKIEQDNGCDGTYESTPLDNTSYVTAGYTISAGLSPNTCYQFRIDSYNLNGVLNGISQPTVQVTTLPAVPTNLINNTNTTTSITYDWDDMAGATSYKVYQTDVSGNNSTLISSPTTSTYTKTGMTANTQYCIKVSSVSVVGEGPAATFICAYASADVPVNLTASSKTISSILWSWLSGGAQSFFYAFTNTPAANSGWISGLSWNESSLVANTQYQCFVKAKNADGDETTSINLSTYTAIENPSVTFGTIDSTSLAMSSVVSNLGGSSALYFENTTSSLNSGWITVSSWTNTSLTPNTQYTYRVKARNGNAEETIFSSTVSKYTASAVPSLTVGESLSDTQISLRIQANSNPSGTGYQIYRSTTGTGDPTSNPGGWVQVQDWTAHTNNDTFFDTGLTPGTSYYYLARTRNGEATPLVSAWSLASSIATDAVAAKISETSGKVVNSWYNGTSLDLSFHTNSVVGVAYYRFKFDSASNTDLNFDAVCIDSVDAQLGKWGTGGNPSSMGVDLGKTFNTSGTYYGHFVACASGTDVTPGTADDIRVSNSTNPQINFGPFKFDNDIPTITNNYAFSGVLKAATQTVTLAPADGAGSGIAEVRYCTDSNDTCAPFPASTVLASPYQFSYSTSVDQYVRYQTKDTAGNLSAVGSYHIMIDAVAPVISSIMPTQTSGTLKTPTDNIYAAGDTVRIKVAEQNIETGLTGTVLITSASASYNSGSQSMLYDGANHLYYYDWNTTGRMQAADYTLTVTLTDSVGNAHSNNGTVINIDNTNPSVTVLQVTDVTSAGTSYTNSRTINVSTLTASDAHSNVAYYKVADLATDTSAPVVMSTDFTLTSAPSNYSITAAEGLTSVFAWVMDAANNISTAAKQLITLDLTNPNISALNVADQSSGSTSYTNAALVNIPVLSVSDSNPLVKYLVNQSASTPSVAIMNSNGVVSAPGTYTITGGEGLKTFYVWVMDAAENIGSTSTTITYDITLPTVTSVRYTDADLNGQMDRVHIRFSESLMTLTGSVVNGNGITIAGHSINAGTGVLSTSSITNDTLTLVINETGIETASMPAFSYNAAVGDIQDLSENRLANVASGAITPSDGVAPVKTGMIMEDTNGNGKIDRITVTYSENLQAISNDAAHWTVANIPSTGTVSSITATAGTVTVYINISEGASAEDTAVNSLTVAFATAGAVQDSAGNAAIGFLASAPVDSAKPVFVTKQTNDLDGNGKLDALKLTSSEPISDISLAAANFSLSAGNSRSVNSAYTGTVGGLNFVNGIATGSTADDAVFYVKLTEGLLVDTGDLPTLSYTAGTLKDLNNLLAVSSSSMALSDNSAPVLVSVTLKDTNVDGAIETAEFKFSENMNDASLTVGGWSIGSSSATGFSTTVQGDTDVNDDSFLVTLSNGITGTNAAVAPVSYSAATGGLLDINSVAFGNRSSGASPTEIDKAAPIITSVVYSDNGTSGDVTDDTIAIVLSENIDDTTLNLSTGGSHFDFSVLGSGSIANATTVTGTSNDNTVTIQLRSGDTALTPGVSAVSLLSGAVSDLASLANASTSTSGVTTNGALVINEIMWGGTSASTTTDEYIEIRNLNASSVDFSVTPHALYINGTLWKLINSGTIPGNGYFLISRYDMSNGASTLLTLTVGADHIKDVALAAIPDSALQVKLYKGSNSSGILLDTADDGAGVPFTGTNSGTYAAMERNNTSGSGTVASSWHTANGSTNFSNINVRGTPKTVNVIDAQSPSFSTSPETRTPVPNGLRPDAQPEISVQYNDNAGGSGINAAQTKIYLDLDQNLSTSGTVGSTTLTGCETDKTSQATITGSGVSLTPSSALAHGRYRACVLIKDISGNESTTLWDFWIDNFSITVTEVMPARLIVQAGVDSEIIGVTKASITTYGAGLNLTSMFPTLTSGSNTINKTNVLYDSLLQKKIGSGSFAQQHGYDGYLDTSANNQVESVSAESLDAITNSQIKTYEVYLRYKITGITGVQAAGVYTGNVGFNMGLTY